MKAIFWNPMIQKTVQGTIWQEVDDTKIEMDYEYLEEWFSMRAPLSQSTNKVATKVNFVESNLRPERAKNVELILCRLKASHAMITNNLWSMDAQNLTPELV